MTEIRLKKKNLIRFISHLAQVFEEKYNKQREESSNYIVAFNLHLWCYWWEVSQVKEEVLESLLVFVGVKWKLSKYQAKTSLQKLAE